MSDDQSNSFMSDDQSGAGNCGGTLAHSESVSLASNDVHSMSIDENCPDGGKVGGTKGHRFDSRISIALERCDLCLGARRTFYCVCCIDEGLYTKSVFGRGFQGKWGSKRDVKNGSDCEGEQRDSVEEECFAEKLLRWSLLKAERLKLTERIEDTIVTLRAVDQATRARLIQERIISLQKMVESSKQSLQQEEKRLLDLQEKTTRQLLLVKSVQHKQMKICEYIRRLQMKFETSSEQLGNCLAELVKVRRLRIWEITHDVFPIKEICPKSSAETDTMLMSTVSLLADASRTAYIKGRWVYNDGGWEQMFSIVEPTLPGNGDYSTFASGQIENREAVPGTSIELSYLNPSCTITAGLSLTSQLVSLLAYYLDINMPLSQAYIEFNGGELSEKKFWSTVFKLNRNILYLCFTQNVHLESLQPRHTLYNLLMLLNAPQLGSNCIAERDAVLMQSLEKSLIVSNVDLDLSDTEDHCDAIERDWEQVPVSLPEMEIQSHRPISASYFLSAPNSESSVTSIAGGLMSSAANSVASFWSWRGGWGKTDK
jgi:beclin 1-associated autophagy-related key regulator